MICPILSSNTVTNNLNGLQPCITTCAMRIGNSCALTVLAKKAIKDSKATTSTEEN